ncbi:uncharacterized protein TNCV_2757891 [Trichonephila clavipes]|nr:uncharacterized protein TNCV_2757891 [Trichonephila clavipes]
MALYRSPLTVTLWPSSFLKNYGPLIPPAHKAHQTVSFSGCNGHKRSRESGSGGPERKIQKGSEHRVPKRALSSSYKTNINMPKFKKRSRIEETVTPSTSGCNPRPRNRRRVESRPTMEMKTQQGRPVPARNSKGKHYSPYIEEQARVSAADERWRVYLLDPRPDAVALYSGCTSGKRRAWFLANELPCWTPLWVVARPD